MTAKFEKRRTELYAMDLVWLLTKVYYDIQTPEPSKYEMEHKPVDTRSAEEIKRDMLQKARGL